MANILTINFGLANPDPGNYRIKFWPASNPSNVITSFVSTSPLVITGLSECLYNGTIESVCTTGGYSTPQTFSAQCPYSSLSYIPCALSTSLGNITPSDIYLEDGITDVTTGVQLYNSSGNALIGVTLISNSSGTVFFVNDTTGIVGTPNGDSC